MNILRKLWRNSKDDRPQIVIRDSELALDAEHAKSIIAEGGAGGTRIALSADNQRIFFASKQALAPNEVALMRKTIEQGRVALKHFLFLTPMYPVFVIKATIYDRPSDPFWLETFPDVDRNRLTLQAFTNRKGHPLGICFHFFDNQASLIFRAGYYTFSSIPILDEDMAKAESHLQSLSPSVRDYKSAVAQVMRENP